MTEKKKLTESQILDAALKAVSEIDTDLLQELFSHYQLLLAAMKEIAAIEDMPGGIKIDISRRAIYFDAILLKARQTLAEIERNP